MPAKVTKLTQKDRERIMAYLSEYLDDFLLVGYDLKDESQWLLRTHSGKTTRAVVSLANDAIYSLVNHVPPEDE